MIKSMTGFGSAKGSVGSFSVTMDLRSVNNRYLDLNIKLPRMFLFAEPSLKTFIQERVSRGKLDLFISIESNDSQEVCVSVDRNLADAYYHAIEQIGTHLNIDAKCSAIDIARFPDVLAVEKNNIDQNEILSDLLHLADAVIQDYNLMRMHEGEKLCEDMLKKVSKIESLVGEVELQAPRTVQAYFDRLHLKLNELMEGTGISEERILAEAAIFADKVATDEETVRLRSHISQFRKMLNDGSPIGRKLDFLIQEFNREANTIGSKCQDSEISYMVVDIKSEIEKLREQIQNIE